jgi:hypothetical protein
MIAAGEDNEGLVGDLVHETVFISDAARPAAFEFMLERFGFADSAEGVAHGFDDQTVMRSKSLGSRAYHSV